MNNKNGSWFQGIRAKLLIMVVVPTIILGIVSFFALTGIKDQTDKVNTFGQVRVKIAEYTGELRSHNNGLARFIWLAYAKHDDPQGRRAALDNAHERIKNFDKFADLYGKLPISEKGKTIFNRIHEPWKNLTTAANEVILLLEKNTSESDELARKEMLATFNVNLKSISDIMHEAADHTHDTNEAMMSQAEQESHRIINMVLIFVIAGSLLTIIFGLFTASKVSKDLIHITQEVSSSSQQVDAASGQLAAAGQQLSTGATEGAASLEETVASLEELSSMVKLNAENAQQAADLSQDGKQSAERGETEIRQLIEAMAAISSSSKKIEEIINVIDDIAFQTNILALNAAVEAARAGEQGKGFAVVAEAVRTLAQRSGGAAKEITTLIKDSVDKVENGSKIASQSAVVLNAIVTSIKKIADLNKEIASASQEQSTGIGQINTAMNQLDQVTQSNASSAEESAAASEELSAQSKMLQEMVNNLARVVYGNDHSIGGNLNMPNTWHGSPSLGSAGGHASSKRFQHFNTGASGKGEVVQFKSWKEKHPQYQSQQGKNTGVQNGTNGTEEVASADNGNTGNQAIPGF